MTALLSAGEFIIDGQRVRTTPAAAYRNGSADDVAPSVRLQAQGPPHRAANCCRLPGIGTVTRIRVGDLSLFTDGFEDDNPARR